MGRSRDCPEEHKGKGKGDAPALGALNYKGASKGKGKGGFQGKCYICWQVGHTARECKGKGKGKGTYKGEWGKGKGGKGGKGAYGLSQGEWDSWASWEDYADAWGNTDESTGQGANAVTRPLWAMSLEST